MPSLLPTVLETPRLRLCAPQPGDGAEVNAAVRETFCVLSRWMRWADHVPDILETEQRVCGAAAQFEAGTDYTFYARLKETGVFVAAVGLHGRDPEVPSWEVGYWQRNGYTGQGYVTEAVSEVTRSAINRIGARRVEIRCDPRNEKSRAVAERCGYQLEGRLRDEQIAPDGSLRDTLIFSLLAREYPPLPRSRS